jgi:hypothetical protein
LKKKRSKEVGTGMNAEKTKYMFLSCEQNGGQIYNIKIGNKSFESEAKFKHFDRALTHQKYMHEMQVKLRETLM